MDIDSKFCMNCGAKDSQPSILDDSLVEYDGDGTLISAWGDMREYTIPEGILVIKGEAFTKCHNLVKVTIPRRLVRIGNDAFPSSLREIVLRSRHLDSKARDGFKNCSSLEKVVVPFASMLPNAQKLVGHDVEIYCVDDFTSKVIKLQ